MTTSIERHQGKGLEEMVLNFFSSALGSCHTPNLWLACAALRNPLSLPSQCFIFSQTQDVRGSLPNSYFIYLKY